MQDPINGDAIPADFQQPDYWLMISDLMSIIERVRTSLRIASDAHFCEEAGDNVVVLDDTAPQHQPHNAALSDCALSLREALQFLLEARSSTVQADRAASRLPRSFQGPAAC
jgi:hypothetical protein